MIRMLRTIGLNLWLATLLTIPVSFFTLAGLKPLFAGLNPVFCAGTIFLVSLAGVGFLVDMTARKMIGRFLAEGLAWEQAGVISRARKAYFRAVRIFDTFIFRPFSGRKMTARICGAIARFSAGQGMVNAEFNPAIIAYLKLHPEDEDIAMIWLKRVQNTEQITPEHQTVLGLLVEHHFRKPEFLEILADIFIHLERKDFTAQKIFQHMIESEQFQEKYSDRIDQIISRPDDTLGGMLHRDRTIQDRPVQAKKAALVHERMKQTAQSLKKGLSSLYTVAAGLSGHVCRSIQKAAGFVRYNRRAKKMLKFGFLSLAFIWMGVFMINTISHLFKTEAVMETPVKEIAVEVPKPFTIQVAAYLKQEHANRYVAGLKAKGLDARVKKVDGGGKSWYLVSVSEFVDKQSAAAYGKKLKREKIIEEFFVNNK